MPKDLPAPRGKHDLRFTFSQWDRVWETSIPLPESPFGQDTLKVVVEDGTAWDFVRDDELALVDRVLDWLPELLPVIIQKLRAQHESLEDAQAFRKVFNQASIWLSDRDERPRKSWTFVIERLAFEGDNFGVNLRFIEKDFQDMFAGD